MSESTFFVSARALIIQDGKILMGFEPANSEETRGNHWETPGGRIKSTEDVVTGLKRELVEEIGSEIKIIDKAPFFFQYNAEIIHEKLKDTYGMLIFFESELLGEPNLEKATDDEFVDLKYISKEEFFKLIEEDKIMLFDKKYIPEIMEKLGLW